MKKKLKKLTPFLILLFLTVWVFRAWFAFKPISAGDWGFFHFQNLRERLPPPLLWNNDGLGRVDIYHWATPYFNLLTYFLASLNFPWPIIEKVIWPWPFLILTIFSSWYLAKVFFPKNVFWFFGSLVFLFNTYILMIVGGGQMGVAMAYAVAPLVLGLFINLINSYMDRWIDGLMVRNSILTGVVLAIQVMWDPRIAYITMTGAGLYWIINLLFINGLTSFKIALRSLLYTFAVPGLIAAGLHFYWLLPLVLTKRAVLPAGLGEPGWVEFLSFGNFSDSISLLHPNWPENIFGKTYFMRPEFLILPILVFSSLLFIGQLKSSRVKRNISFFAFLGLVGAFLAKGSKPPFGEVYLWLFKYFPGMNMFRDPTKFYLLVCLSYSLLIPFSLEQIVKKFNKKFGARCLVLGAFLIYWLFLIRPAWLGQLGGTFKAKEVPPEYVVLKDFIHNQEGFFRTFWVPKRQRFGFFSNNHPAIEGSELLSEEELAIRGVKYVIIPYDSEGEIFLEDRKYDSEQRLALEEELDKVSWLKKIDVTDKIAVYQTPSYKDHFFIADEEVPSVEWTMVNPTKYTVRILGANQPFKLVFSETYDELWQAKIGEKIIPSTIVNNLNSFIIDQTGDFDITVEFAAQKYVDYGLVISGLTLLTILYSLAKFTSLSKVIMPALSIFLTALSKFSLLSKS